MSYDISGSLTVSLSMAFNRTLDLNTIDNPLSVANRFSISFGSGANQISQLFKKTVVLADGDNSTLNLYDSGNLFDDYGNALAISALKLLYIKNNSADADLLLFGGNSADLPICSNANDQIIIKPGSVFVWTDMSAAGTVITTNKNLRIAHNGAGTSTMSVDIVAGGINAALEA
jgi:hypothetical protein